MGVQSVRRKGYVYIICSKNPKHKQRYVYSFLNLLLVRVSHGVEDRSGGMRY